jgi:hypothetical protein
MSAYFARHQADKASMSNEWGDESDPSAGYIAWLLWGGEPGRRWADSLTARLNKTADRMESLGVALSFPRTRK